MKTTTGKSRIIGVTLGEAVINLIKPGIPPITAQFALVRDDEEFAGLVERRLDWSDETMKALAALQACMEKDMLEHLFEAVPETESASEPQQV